jgi:hypothetical protein
MSKLFKLIFLALVSAFLIGCGSSGSSDDKKTTDDEKLSLELLKSSFPDLNITALVISETESFISYEVTQSDIDDITAALIKKEFSGSGDTYVKDTPYGRAKAHFVGNVMELSIPADEDAIFQEIFPKIELKIADIAKHLHYNNDVVSDFTGYIDELEEAGFECADENGWKCKKTADGIDYVWYIEANSDLISYTISNAKKSTTDDKKLSLELLKSSFPDLNIPTSSIIEVESDINYEASQGEIDGFITALTAKEFSLDGDIYKKDTPYGLASAYIQMQDGNSIELFISTDKDVNHSSVMHQEVFPSIGVEPVGVTMHFYYSDDMTSGFSGYVTELEKVGFKCQENTDDGYWQCKKTVDDIDYVWYAEANLIMYTISNSKKATTGEEKLSLELLKLSFPDFNVTSSDIEEIESEIYYEASQSVIDDYIDALTAKGFTDMTHGLYTKNTPYSAEANINDHSIALNISTDKDVNHSSALHQEVFPPLSAEAVSVDLHLHYDDDITDSFAAYMDKLKEAGFDDCEVNTDEEYWQCKKTADGIDYEWYGEEDYIAYTISKH